MSETFHHEVYCNASRELPVGCEACSCRAGREIKRLRTELAAARKALASIAAHPGQLGQVGDGMRQIARAALSSKEPEGER